MPKRAYHNYWVYILTNKPNGTLYVGVTGGIDDRMERHFKGEGSAFTTKYKLKILVYFEEFQYVEDAIKREKQLKNWHRQWKFNLINKCKFKNANLIAKSKHLISCHSALDAESIIVSVLLSGFLPSHE